MIAWAGFEHLREAVTLPRAAEVPLQDGMPDAAHSLVLPSSLLPELRFIPKWPLGRDESTSIVHSESLRLRSHTYLFTMALTPLSP